MNGNPDFTFESRGTIGVLQPLTKDGVLWCEEHLSEDALMYPCGYVLETHYAADILVGIRHDRLEIEGLA